MTSATMQMFNALSQDMSLQRSYAKDKNAVMRAFGLTSGEKAAIASGDDAKIKKLLGGAEPVCFLIGLTITSKRE